MVGYGGSSASSYLADPTSPIPSHCASIVATSTLRVNCVYIKLLFEYSSRVYVKCVNHLMKFSLITNSLCSSLTNQMLLHMYENNNFIILCCPLELVFSMLINVLLYIYSLNYNITSSVILRYHL